MKICVRCKDKKALENFAVCKDCLELISPHLVQKSPKTINFTENYGIDYAYNKPRKKETQINLNLSILLKHLMDISPQHKDKLTELHNELIPQKQTLLEDPKFSKDPRPLESLESIITPGIDFYDGPALGIRKKNIPYKHVFPMWLDMLVETSKIPETLLDPSFNYDQVLTNPSPPDHPLLSTSDRQINESAYIKNSKALWPHPDTSSIAKHLRVRSIMTKAKCTAEEATQIADSCIMLESTPEVADKFCQWAKAKGADKLISYLWKFVIGLAEVEAPSDEKEPWEDEPVTARHPVWGSYLDDVRGHNGICEDTPVENYEYCEREPGLAEIIDDKIIWPESKLDFMEDDDEESWEAQMAEWKPEERNSYPGNMVAYHVFENFGLKQEKINNLIGLYSWDFMQDLRNKPLDVVEDAWNKKFSWKPSRKLQAYLKMIPKQKTLGEMSKFRKRIHPEIKEKLNRVETGIFWTECDLAKARLQPKHFSISCKSMLKKIANSNGHLGHIGVWLHKVQKDEIKVTPKPSKFEWGMIWDRYEEQKAMHAE